MRIKIMGCSKDTYWYSDIVGEEMEAKLFDEKEGWIIEDDGDVLFVREQDGIEI